LTTDVWKVEHYAYPDTIRLFVRVQDTLGNVITHMAKPYARPDAPNYFPQLVEALGEGRRARVAPIDQFDVREIGAADSIPAYVSLAIDNSGSMKGTIETINLGTELFIGLKRPVDRVALTAFHREIVRVFPLMTDTAAMLKATRAHAAKGLGLYSSVWDGVLQAVKELDTVPINELKVVVVFADGDENTSYGKLGDIYEHAARNNISIYCVGFGYAQDQKLQDLALYTGGKYYRAYTKKDLLAIFMDIWRSLRNYYLVTYRPPEYDGMHYPRLTVSVPGRDTMLADAQYDKTPLTPIDPRNEFSRQILFPFRSSIIDSTSFPTIDTLARALQRYERVELEIQGHTDNIGTEEFNQKLSEARAESVRVALVERGVGADRLRTRGFGFTVPVATNETEEGRQQNRRTVFRILRK
jgi:outer membrane protein OmpA-like peptidoglycan-associated protein